MDLHRQHGKQPDKNIVSKRLNKDESTGTYHIKKKEEEQIKWGLALCSFEDEYD